MVGAVFFAILLTTLELSLGGTGFEFLGSLLQAEATLPPSLLLTMLIPCIILGLPFLYFLPILRAGSILNLWQVPDSTFLFPRSVVSLLGTTMVGAALSYLALCIASDFRFGILFVLQLLFVIPFVISANRRFKRHPNTELVMPLPFPFPFRKKM